MLRAGCPASRFASSGGASVFCKPLLISVASSLAGHLLDPHILADIGDASGCIVVIVAELETVAVRKLIVSVSPIVRVCAPMNAKPSLALRAPFAGRNLARRRAPSKQLANRNSLLFSPALTR